MRAKVLAVLAAPVVAVAATAVAAAPVGAAVVYYFYGYAGGSSIRAADNTVTSSLTAESAVFGPDAGPTDRNSLAAVRAQRVVRVGAVRTSAAITAVPGGTRVAVTARLADVNVLNGLITASAITVTTTTSRIGGIASSYTHGSFAGLRVAGARLPADVPQNDTIRVGDVATLAINAGQIADRGDASAALGAGLVVQLLKQRGDAAAGAEIYLAQTYTLVAPDSSPSTGHGTGGQAYATAIHGTAGKAVDVRSDPTVPTTVFTPGTGGRTTTNTLAALNLAPVARIGAVRTTGNGTNTRTVAAVTTTASLADVDLLGGLITAKAVTVRAHSSLAAAPSASCRFVGLRIDGRALPATVRPNTVIDLGVGRVTLCRRGAAGRTVGVRAVDIVLGRAGYGLPAGAQIQVAVATAMVK